MADMADGEPARRKGRAQRAGGVAALVVVGDVVCAPQPGCCRHRQQHPPARRELAPQHLQRADIVVDMLQHVEQHDEVIAAILQLHLIGQQPAAHRDAAAPAGERPGGFIGLDRVDPAEALQHGEVGAGAGAHLQYPRAGLQRHLLPDQRRDDLPPRGEPPMVGIDIRHAIVDGAFHQATTGWIAAPIVSRTM